MDVKIYIGKQTQTEEVNNKIVIIDFIGTPNVDDTISFTYYPFYPSPSVPFARTLRFKSVRVFSGEVTISSDPIQQAINYVTAFNLDYSNSGQFIVSRVGATVTIQASNGSPLDTLSILPIGSSFATIKNQTNSINNIDFQKLDLFGDETIELTSKLSDIEKLSNVFMDYSNTFTIPATDNNSNILEHYYDQDLDGLNANVRMIGYIEVDNLPFRYGKIEINGANLKKFRPSNYKITFYSGLLQLSELFADDLLSELDYERNNVGDLEKVYDFISRYSYDLTNSNMSSLISGTYSSEVFLPLINDGDKKWSYKTSVNDDNNKDIYTDAGAISSNELRPALRLIRIIEAIENKYGISFTRNFLGKAFFNNLFLWMNGTSSKNMILTLDNQFEVVTPSFGTPEWFSPYLDFTDDTINIQYNFPGYDIFQLSLYWDFSPSGNLRTFDDSDFTLTVSFVDMRPGREGSVFFTQNKNFTVGDLHYFQDDFSASALGMTFDEPLKFIIRLDSSKPLMWNSVRLTTVFPFGPAPSFVYSYKATGGTYSNFDIGLLAPNIKVLDFLQGIMKMFKLVITPLNTDTFYLDTIDSYYQNGDIININDYTDNESVDIEPFKIYNRIKFLYDKTNNVLGKKYREFKDPTFDEIGYGDLRAEYKTVEYNNSLDVKVPFDNMLYERLSDDTTETQVDFIIGESIQVSETGDVSNNQSKPIIFFDNGITNTNTIKFKYKNSTPFATNYVRLIGTTDNELLQQVTHTLNFGAEIDPWHNIRIDNSLYLNYWSNWINTIYSLKQRKYIYEANLPSILIDRLSLNDRLIIAGNRYKINDFNVNLTTGDVKFSLFTDIYEPTLLEDYSFIGSTFSYSGFYNQFYITDFTEKSDNGSYFLYGSFTKYNGLTASRVIKMKSNGEQDLTFNTNLGGPNSEPFAAMRLYRYDDDKLLVAGFYTSYNGVSGTAIRRLNPNGTIDTTFNTGSFGTSGGFRFGTKVLVDGNNKILLGGLFSSYNSNPANNLIRLSATGSFDSTFNIGSGFNNTVTDVVEVTTGTMSNQAYIVSGYFTSYNGASYSSIVKVSATGSVDTSFNVGSGLLPAGAPVYLLPDTNNSVLAIGSFTSYKGVSAGRIVKISATGSNISTFGTGFNGDLVFARYMSDNSIFIGGSFSTYNGKISHDAIILNNDGTIRQTFPDDLYENCYCIDDDVYGVRKSDYKLCRLSDNQKLDILNHQIYQNSGYKYYAINLISNSDWIVEKVDIGFGTTWIDVNTPYGNGSSEVSITIKNNTSTYRTMALKIKSDSIEKWVNVYQEGL